jgi:hypothetical protein
MRGTAARVEETRKEEITWARSNRLHCRGNRRHCPGNCSHCQGNRRHCRGNCSHCRRNRGPRLRNCSHCPRNCPRCRHNGPHFWRNCSHCPRHCSHFRWREVLGVQRELLATWREVLAFQREALVRGQVLAEWRFPQKCAILATERRWCLPHPETRAFAGLLPKRFYKGSDAISRLIWQKTGCSSAPRPRS